MIGISLVLLVFAFRTNRRHCSDRQGRGHPVCPLTLRHSASLNRTPPPPSPFALVPTPVCRECTPTNAEFKNRNSSDSDSVSSFKDKQRRKTSLSLSDQGRQDGKQRETAETQSVCFKRDECVISAVVRWFPAHTLCTFCTCAPSTLEINLRHQRERRLVLSSR